MANKHFRMIWGIVCAPIKAIIRRNRHESCWKQRHLIGSGNKTGNGCTTSHLCAM